MTAQLFPVGAKVRIHMPNETYRRWHGRTGTVTRIPSGCFADQRYVTLDMRTKERTIKVELFDLAHLADI